MDYLAIYKEYRGKHADIKRADYWRQYEPYLYLIDESENKAYPLNRFYKKLGQPKGTPFIPYPEHNTRIYVYRDGEQPFYSIGNCKKYIENIYSIEHKYYVCDF